MYPIISVLMPAYNAGKFIAETIESILSQTYPHFELIIINDGSTDNTKDVVFSFNDSRIRYIENEKNLEKIETNNRGLILANGTYIAKMDADDVAKPCRFEKQLDYFNAHPDVSIVGGWIQKMDSGHVERYPEKDDEIKVSFVGENVLANSTAMFRTEDVRRLALKYDSRFIAYAEDFKFWTDAAIKGLKFANVQDVLVNYRIHEDQATEINKDKQIVNVDLIRVEYINSILPGLLQNPIDEAVFAKLFNRKHLTRDEYYRLKQIIDSVHNLEPVQVKKDILIAYLEAAFLKVAKRYYRVDVPHSLSATKQAFGDNFFLHKLGMKEKAIFLIKCLTR